MNASLAKVAAACFIKDFFMHIAFRRVTVDGK